MDQNNLFPESIDDYELEETVDVDDSATIGYKPAPLFDFKTGEFVLNGNGQIVTADGITAWAQWCENILHTYRFFHDSYSDDIGIDYVSVFKAKSREEIETLLETEISEALAVDPYGRTQFVQTIEFDRYSTDEVVVRIVVIGANNENVTIETVLTI